ncbi:TPA: hypothetical protein RZH73_000568 [Campylobacter coli]|nr:hypothetical protein [Campylobacter coli]
MKAFDGIFATYPSLEKHIGYLENILEIRSKNGIIIATISKIANAKQKRFSKK